MRKIITTTMLIMAIIASMNLLVACSGNVDKTERKTNNNTGDGGSGGSDGSGDSGSGSGTGGGSSGGGTSTNAYTIPSLFTAIDVALDATACDPRPNSSGSQVLFDTAVFRLISQHEGEFNALVTLENVQVDPVIQFVISINGTIDEKGDFGGVVTSSETENGIIVRQGEGTFNGNVGTQLVAQFVDKDNASNCVLNKELTFTQGDITDGGGTGGTGGDGGGTGGTGGDGGGTGGTGGDGGGTGGTGGDGGGTGGTGGDGGGTGGTGGDGGSTGGGAGGSTGSGYILDGDYGSVTVTSSNGLDDVDLNTSYIAFVSSDGNESFVWGDGINTINVYFIVGENLTTFSISDQANKHVSSYRCFCLPDFDLLRSEINFNGLVLTKFSDPQQQVEINGTFFVPQL